MPSKLAQAALLGQFLALLIAATAATSTALAQIGISLPAVQSMLSYALLLTVYAGVRLSRGQQLRSFSRPWWQFLALAALDFEANFLVVTAFRFTSVTSVTLLDSWSVPVVLALTRGLGMAAYRRGHYGGAALCVLGLALLVVSDRSGAASSGAANSGAAALWGDALVIVAATLYGCANVLQERLLAEVEPAELLFALGLFGTLLSAAQALVLELSKALAAPWRLAAVWPWLGYTCSMFSFYSLVPLELELGGAAVLNLSLLSSDMWAALARLIFFGGFSTWGAISFLLAFGFVAVGVSVFSRSGEVKSPLLLAALEQGGGVVGGAVPREDEETAELLHGDGGSEGINAATAGEGFAKLAPLSAERGITMWMQPPPQPPSGQTELVETPLSSFDLIDSPRANRVFQQEIGNRIKHSLAVRNEQCM